MKNLLRNIALTLLTASILTAWSAFSQDWPQWRGPDRDGKVVGFTAPATWPSSLKQVWKVTVGAGESTPALVGNKLYVFTRSAETEVLRCLDSATGNEIWKDEYDALPATGAPGAHPGPRSSPTVTEGKVVTLGVRGMVSCLDAVTGKVLWRKDEFRNQPQFFTAFSPLVDGGVVYLHLGGPVNGATPANGAVVAYDLATGEQKWRWTGDTPHYGSAVLATIAGTKCLVSLTDQNLVGLNAATGALLWKTAVGAQKNTTPVVVDQTVYTFVPGSSKAFKVNKSGDQFTVEEVWSSTENTVQYNTPVFKNGLFYGLSQRGVYFALSAQNGKTVWSSDTAAAPAAPAAPAAGGGGARRGGGGGGGEFRSAIVDAGSVLFGVSPASELIVMAPSDKNYTELARIKVADKKIAAHPIISGKRVFVKDEDSVALWTLD